MEVVDFICRCDAPSKNFRFHVYSEDFQFNKSKSNSFCTLISLDTFQFPVLILFVLYLMKNKKLMNFEKASFSRGKNHYIIIMHFCAKKKSLNLHFPRQHIILVSMSLPLWRVVASQFIHLKKKTPTRLMMHNNEQEKLKHEKKKKFLD